MHAGRSGQGRWARLATIVALLGLALLVPLVSSDSGRWTAGSLALCCVMFGVLSLGWAAPVSVLVVLAPLFLLSQLRYDLPREFSLPVLCSLYLVASYGHGRRSLRFLGIGAVSVGLAASAALTTADGWSDSRYLMISSWGLLSGALGEAVRNRRAYLVAVEDRAREAETSRELEAQRRVTEERLRIAREVHDLVAHHIAVVSVQAGVAGHLFDRDPAAARQALGQVREAASSVLQELGGLLGLLRAPAQADEPSREPSPAVADVPRLLESLAAAGLAVSWEQHGAPDSLPANVELAAFRLLQESLTNAHKHGDGRADVVLTYAIDGLEIDVDNRVGRARQPSGGGGYGLLGMKERVGAIGGTLSAVPTGDGRFHVHARLPVRVPVEDCP